MADGLDMQVIETLMVGIRFLSWVARCVLQFGVSMTSEAVSLLLGNGLSAQSEVPASMLRPMSFMTPSLLSMGWSNPSVYAMKPSAVIG